MQQEALNRIIDQVNNLHENNWAGVDINQMLDEMDDDMANTELLLFTNTIHQVIRHLIADRFLIIKRLSGVDFQLTEEENWVPVQILKNINWTDSKNEIQKSKNDLLDALKAVYDKDLDKPILKEHSSVYTSLHGHIQHFYYHIGQISQMKKAIENL